MGSTILLTLRAAAMWLFLLTGAIALAAAQDANRAEAQSNGVRAAHGSDITLHVVDAETDTSLEAAQIRLVERTPADRPVTELDDAGALVVRRTANHARARSVARSEPKRSGASPFYELRRRTDAIVYVTASGYTHAAFAPDGDCPGTVTVLLERTCSLELVWEKLPEGARPHVSLSSNGALSCLFPDREDVAGCTFEDLPPQTLTAAAGFYDRERGSFLSARAELQLEPGETALHTLRFDPVATELRLTLLLPREVASEQPIEQIRFGVPRADGGLSRCAKVRRDRSRDIAGFEAFTPVDSPRIVPGPFEILVLPHGRRFRREIDALEPVDWSVEVEPASVCSLQVWDVLHDRPYAGPVWIERLDEANPRPPAVRRNPFHGRPRIIRVERVIALDARGRAECVLPVTAFRILTEPEAGIVGGALEDFPAGEERPRMLTVDVRPLARVQVSGESRFLAGFEACRLEDDRGRDVRPAATVVPPFTLGVGPYEFLAYDASGPHWLVVRGRSPDDPERHHRVWLVRGELTLVDVSR